MKDLITYIVEGITGSKVTVKESEDDGVVVFTIDAPKEVIGRIIGKGGKTINAIKQVVKIRAIKENKKIDIQVAEVE